MVIKLELRSYDLIQTFKKANRLCDKCSVSVFGVSAESMQCTYDEKGNSVPTILLLMQQRLYSQEGLKVMQMGIKSTFF